MLFPESGYFMSLSGNYSHFAPILSRAADKNPDSVVILHDQLSGRVAGEK